MLTDSARDTVSRVWRKVPEKSTLILAVPIFSYKTVWDRSKEAPTPKINQLNLFSHFERTLTWDRRTQTQGHIFGIRNPDLSIHYATLVLYAKILHPCVKSRMSSAYARDHVICLRCPKCHCTRRRRRQFAVLYFRSWAYSRIYGHFQQHFTAHAHKRLFMQLRWLYDESN